MFPHLKFSYLKQTLINFYEDLLLFSKNFSFFLMWEKTTAAATFSLTLKSSFVSF